MQQGEECITQGIETQEKKGCSKGIEQGYNTSLFPEFHLKGRGYAEEGNNAVH
jgi:hypothetical protein